MEFHPTASGPQSEEDMDLKRGSWTVEEDLILMNYIHNHGEGRWNSLARCAGLKRTGKSCRLRWLNYLRPDVRRGDISPEEQLLILELHSRWGNRWSKIAQQLPGRTDNEIKNYWRTRVQKHAKQLHCDVNSKQFKDVMRYIWMPRLLERIQVASGSTAAAGVGAYEHLPPLPVMEVEHSQLSSESSSMAGSSSEYSLGTPISQPLTVSECLADCSNVQGGNEVQVDQLGGWWPELLPSPIGYGHLGSSDFDNGLWGEGTSDSLWSLEDIWSQQQQL